jgi:hypothetical protein
VLEVGSDSEVSVHTHALDDARDLCVSHTSNICSYRCVGTFESPCRSVKGRGPVAALQCFFFFLKRRDVRFQVLTAASMKVTVVWDVAPCSLVDIDLRFRGAYCLHHQGNESFTTFMIIFIPFETKRDFNS